MITIGIDPHKSSHTAVALDATGRVVEDDGHAFPKREGVDLSSPARKELALGKGTNRAPLGLGELRVRLD